MRKSFLVSIISIVCLAGCTVDLAKPGPGQFTCVTDEDCLEGFECRPDEYCYERSFNNIVGCIDADNDGYGVGPLEDRQTCARCEAQGLCGEDCDDSDATRNPGAAEACNGRDDNCNEDIDEPTECGSAQDCQALSPEIPANTSVTCENQRCVVKMAIQTCATEPCPCNANPIACEAASYSEVPDPAECI